MQAGISSSNIGSEALLHCLQSLKAWCLQEEESQVLQRCVWTPQQVKALDGVFIKQASVLHQICPVPCSLCLLPYLGGHCAMNLALVGTRALPAQWPLPVLLQLAGISLAGLLSGSCVGSREGR